jgi:hypothetical protein
MFLDHTRRRSTVGRTPLDEWSAHRRDLYLTTHDTHNRQISMPPVGFEPTISAGERPQTTKGLIQTFRRLKGNMKQVPYWESTNIGITVQNLVSMVTWRPKLFSTGTAKRNPERPQYLSISDSFPPNIYSLLIQGQIMPSPVYIPRISDPCNNT